MKRRSWRYLLVKVVSEEPLTHERIRATINYAVRNLFGEWGLIEISPRVISFDEKSNEAIIRCDLSSVNKMRASLALMTKINDCEVAAFVIRVSGTIKSLKNVYT